MRTLFVGLSIFFLIGFALLSKYEDRELMRNLDVAVTVKIQERIDRSAHLRTAALVGNIMEGATFFASPGFTVVVVLFLTAFSVYDRQRKKWNILAFIIPIALVLLVVAEIYGKSIVHHPAPPFSMIKNPITLFPANYVNEQFSYPSGHAARAVFMALAFFAAIQQLSNMPIKKRLVIGAGLGAYVLLVSVSRVYLGHHWFSDVVGGLLLGSALGVLTWVMKPKYNTHTMSD